ncbi:MAG: 4Fe-4S dicluster domain-containing protein [Planctomycetes bacterium]|nr:4Fe-4S dicluster domain-containing protein [Planctomycetota bacterium]
MAQKDIYQELLDMINREDVVGLPDTPAMIKGLKFQFTLEEADLALKIGLAGGTLEELSAKLGVEKDTLFKQLWTMADKGTMWIDPGGVANPNCRVLGAAAPGLSETGIWGNIRFPYDVELAKNMHEVMWEWARDKLCTLGFPFAPVWAHPWVLPDDAKPEENLAEFLKSQEHFSVSFCPCRLSHWIADPGNHCEHIPETCLHTGDTSRWCVEHNQGREITYEEALDVLKKTNADGLVHTININGFICNCCDDCCPLFMGFHKLNVKTMVPSPFMPKIDENTCIACGDCADLCPVKAIKVDNIAVVDSETCIGCGVCITHCPSESMALERRPDSEVAQIPDDVKQHMG